jgi:hypothetical protein
MTPGTRNDGLRLQLSGSDVGGLRIAGTLPGVVATAAAARNGTGIGLLTASPDSILSWQAPGSSASGVGVDGSGGGSIMLEDGMDPSSWLRVEVYPDYLPSAAQALVLFADSFNDIGPDDVGAADALAGLTTTTEYTLKNMDAVHAITDARLWLDSGASGFSSLSVSLDGTNFYEPTSASDANVLLWGTIAPSASVNIWVRRAISADAASNPSILNLLQWAWQAMF